MENATQNTNEGRGRRLGEVGVRGVGGMKRI